MHVKRCGTEPSKVRGDREKCSHITGLQMTFQAPSTKRTVVSSHCRTSWTCIVCRDGMQVDERLRNAREQPTGVVKIVDVTRPGVARSPFSSLRFLRALRRIHQLEEIVHAHIAADGARGIGSTYGISVGEHSTTTPIAASQVICLTTTLDAVVVQPPSTSASMEQIVRR